MEASRLNGSPTVANGMLYMGSVDRHLYAFSVNGVRPTSVTTRQSPDPGHLVPDFSRPRRENSLMGGP